jgi:3',5'-nucleoside bisphosphate phosphatase
MIVRCDLHLHSDLSPCSDPDMTPGNIVAMAALKGLQAIAITDHQSCGNCGPAMAMADRLGGPLVLPGLEVESQEEIHLLCLFPDLAAAQEMERLVRGAMPYHRNRKDIFGEQHFYNNQDEIIGEEERLLLIASQLDCFELARQALDLGGVCLPAHVDREANSMLTVLGLIPPDFPTRWLELSAATDERQLLEIHPELLQYRFLGNSDAHRLEDIAEPGWPLQIPGFSPDAGGRQKLIQALRP